MIVLLILLNICHWLADYSHLSTNKMLAAKKTGKPLMPIFQHAYMHATLMTCVLLFYTDARTAVLLWSFQLVTHFTIDVLKGKCNVWFPSVANPADKAHWYIFGFDQLLHQIVIIIMVSIVT